MRERVPAAARDEDDRAQFGELAATRHEVRVEVGLEAAGDVQAVLPRDPRRR